MSRARHHEKEKRKDGGSVKEHEYNAVGSPAMEEAKERKKGGKVERKHGGMVEGEGERPKAHYGRKGRARGGRIGADKMPLSSAAKVEHVTKGENPEVGIPSD
jgi:hypothetical protein